MAIAHPLDRATPPAGLDLWVIDDLNPVGEVLLVVATIGYRTALV
jgi:hypothetical protein